MTKNKEKLWNLNLDEIKLKNIFCRKLKWPIRENLWGNFHDDTNYCFERKVINLLRRNDDKTGRVFTLHALPMRTISCDDEKHFETQVFLYFPNLNCKREEKKNENQETSSHVSDDDNEMKYVNIIY